MRILFVHQNFPGQFVHLAPALSRLPGYEVRALSINQRPFSDSITVTLHNPKRANSKDIHPLLTDLESKIIRGESTYQAAKSLKMSGFNPDIIVAHPGWGESIFLADLWPNAKIGIYCEYYYSPTNGDCGFDPEFPQNDEFFDAKLRIKNLNNDLNFQIANRGIAPTHWQRSTYPEHYSNMIDVIHDGIDTKTAHPNKNVLMKLNGSLTLTREDEVITFVNRNLEPHRGYHIFMRALPEIMRHRPKARIIIVGGDDVSYGAKPPSGSWKQIFLDEVQDKIDLSRVHFVGKLPYTDFLQLLQLSRIHIYLTYPFVLSWSLLEAMSTGCAIIASDTAPVKEVIEHNKTGILTDFFDHQELAANTIALLKDSELRQALSEAARRYIIDNYDLKTHCLPKQIEWVHRLYQAS